MNVLFVCSRNQWRSPTAERIFRDRSDINVRSAGLSSKSPRKLSQNDLEWADVVFAMEREHQVRIREEFSNSPPIEVLEIPDEYEFMDSRLVTLLREEVEPRIKQLLSMNQPR